MAMAAEDIGCESSAGAASSSPNSTVNWWATSMQEVQGSSLCSWPSHCDVQLPWRAAGGTAAGGRRRRAADPSCCNGEEEEEMRSTTNSFCARYRSSLGLESQDVMTQSDSHVHLSLEPNTPPDARIWNQVFPAGVGSNGELLHNQVDGDKLLAAFTSKTLRTDIFELPPDHFSKPETNWEFTNYGGGYEHEKLNFLLNNWSIAPLDSQATQNPTDKSASSCTTLNSAFNMYQESSFSQYDLKSEIKQDNNSSSSYSDGASGAGNTMNPVSFSPCFKNYSKEGKQIEASNAPFGTYNCGTSGDQLSLNGSSTGDRPWRSNRNYRNVADVIYFGGALNKPLLDFQASKLHIKRPELQNCKKTSQETSQTGGENVKGEANSYGETKKKKMEDDSHTVQKKQKQEGSIIPSSKLQVPKVKLGDRITALQQIVAPFGKTDTASVLLEAITYIKFMEEQVVLLLNHPYMKPNPSKQRDRNLSGVETRTEAKLDLRSRGLCLVPVSFTPQVCRESTGVEYWTPTYRGCLYR